MPNLANNDSAAIYEPKDKVVCSVLVVTLHKRVLSTQIIPMQKL